MNAFIRLALYAAWRIFRVASFLFVLFFISCFALIALVCTFAPYDSRENHPKLTNINSPSSLELDTEEKGLTLKKQIPLAGMNLDLLVFHRKSDDQFLYALTGPDLGVEDRRKIKFNYDAEKHELHLCILVDH